MSNDEIQNFFDKLKLKEDNEIKIMFKKRNTIHGIFVMGKDYADLKSKNFWRIVSSPQIEAFKKSGDMNLARIFSGSEFQKLALKEA